MSPNCRHRRCCQSSDAVEKRPVALDSNRLESGRSILPSVCCWLGAAAAKANTTAYRPRLTMIALTLMVICSLTIGNHSDRLVAAQSAASSTSASSPSTPSTTTTAAGTATTTTASTTTSSSLGSRGLKRASQQQQVAINSNSAEQQPAGVAPFFSIKNGKTSARLIQQQPAAGRQQFSSPSMLQRNMSLSNGASTKTSQRSAAASNAMNMRVNSNSNVNGDDEQQMKKLDVDQMDSLQPAPVGDLEATDVQTNSNSEQQVANRQTTTMMMNAASNSNEDATNGDNEDEPTVLMTNSGSSSPAANQQQQQQQAKIKQTQSNQLTSMTSSEQQQQLANMMAIDSFSRLVGADQLDDFKPNSKLTGPSSSRQDEVTGSGDNTNQSGDDKQLIQSTSSPISSLQESSTVGGGESQASVNPAQASTASNRQRQQQPIKLSGKTQPQRKVQRPTMNMQVIQKQSNLGNQTPSSLSMSLDGMIMSSRPRATQAASEQQQAATKSGGSQKSAKTLRAKNQAPGQANQKLSMARQQQQKQTDAVADAVLMMINSSMNNNSPTTTQAPSMTTQRIGDLPSVASGAVNLTPASTPNGKPTSANSRRVPFSGVPFSSPASKGQRTKPKASNQFGGFSNPAINGQSSTRQSSTRDSQQVDLMVNSMNPKVQNSARQPQQSMGFGEEQQQRQQQQQMMMNLGVDQQLVDELNSMLPMVSGQQEDKNLNSNADRTRGVSSTSLLADSMPAVSLQRGAQASANQLTTSKLPNGDMLMSVISSEDGRERKLVMISRDTLDSLQKFAQNQQEEEDMQMRMQLNGDDLLSSTPTATSTTSTTMASSSTSSTGAPTTTTSGSRTQQQQVTTLSPITFATSVAATTTKVPSSSSTSTTAAPVESSTSQQQLMGSSGTEDSFREVATMTTSRPPSRQQDDSQTNGMTKSSLNGSKSATNNSKSTFGSGGTKAKSSAQNKQIALQTTSVVTQGANGSSGASGQGQGSTKSSIGNKQTKKQQTPSSPSSTGSGQQANGRSASVNGSSSNKRPKTNGANQQKDAGAKSASKSSRAQVPSAGNGGSMMRQQVSTPSSSTTTQSPPTKTTKTTITTTNSPSTTSTNGQQMPSRGRLMSDSQSQTGSSSVEKTAMKSMSSVDDQMSSVITGTSMTSNSPASDVRGSSGSESSSPAPSSSRFELDHQLDEMERANAAMNGESGNQNNGLERSRNQPMGQRDQENSDENSELQHSQQPISELDGLRAAIPGEPQVDYPIYAAPPARSSFQCQAQSCPGGYYADLDTQCQVFHVCQNDGQMDTFLCPNGTIFSQQHFVCVWWWQVDCSQSKSFYKLNDNIYCNSMTLPIRNSDNPSSSSSSSSSERQKGDVSRNPPRGSISNIMLTSGGGVVAFASTTTPMTSQEGGRASWSTTTSASNSQSQPDTSTQMALTDVEVDNDQPDSQDTTNKKPMRTRGGLGASTSSLGVDSTTESDINQHQQQQLDLLSRKAA